jgi:hypothetical protein
MEGVSYMGWAPTRSGPLRCKEVNYGFFLPKRPPS